MAYDFSSAKDALEEVGGWLKGEYIAIRSGQATPALLDKVQVDSYGSKSPIGHVATVSIEDPRTLRIAPWDKEMIKEIESAVAAANLGVSVGSDDAGVRVSFPEMTEENRKNTVKLLKDRLEEGRVRIKNAREKAWNEVQQKEKDGEVSEDEKFGAKEELQKLVDAANNELEAIFKKKEEEILTV